MDQVSIVKRQVRLDEWRKRIMDCQASGMSVRSWCKTNGFCEQTYYKYLRQIRQELCETFPVPVQEVEKPTVFQKLEVQTPIANSMAAVIIHLPNATVEIADGTSQQTVQAVLLALQSAC